MNAVKTTSTAIRWLRASSQIIASMCFMAAIISQPVMAMISAGVDTAYTTHGSVHISGSIDTGCFQTYFGISSGTLPADYAYSTARNCRTTIRTSIGGLAASTTFYFRTCRFSTADDTTADECAAEVTETTAAEGSADPTQTAVPDVPTHPDFSSGYTVVPMVLKGDGTECVAASDVSAGDWSGSVNTGDSIPTILGKGYWGMIVEFPVGAECPVPETESTNHSAWELGDLTWMTSGYDSSASSIDDPAHRWVVFRTATDARQPAYLAQTGPQFSGALAKLIVQTPGQTGKGSISSAGQIMNCYQHRCHHIYFENLEMTTTVPAQNSGYDAADPIPFTPFITCDSATASSANQPAYIALDRVYMHTGAWPARQVIGVHCGANGLYQIGNYLDIYNWRPGLYPTHAVSVAGSTITIPADTWAFHASDTPIGMATSATFSASGTGSVVGYLAQASPGTNGLTIAYSGVTSPSCNNCTAVASTTVPSDALVKFRAAYSGGTPTLTFDAIDSDTSSTQETVWKPIGDQVYPGSANVFYNNHFKAHGQTVYLAMDDSVIYPITGIRFQMNQLYFPTSRMKSAPDWDGITYTYRNPFEAKNGSQVLFDGNLMDGCAAYQNAGYCVMVLGAEPGEGTRDWLLQYNTVRHFASGVAIYGGGSQGVGDAPTAVRLKFLHWTFLNGRRDLFSSDWGPGVFSGAIGLSPNAEDVTLDRLTIGPMRGLAPYILQFGGSSAGASVLGKRLSFTNSIYHVSNGNYPDWYSQGGQLNATNPAVPAPLSWDAGTPTTRLNASFVSITSTVTPDWTVSGNYCVGGEQLSGTYGESGADLTAAETATATADDPGGCTVAAGETMAARQAAVGFDSTTGATSVSGKGADVAATLQHQGVVTGISVGAPNASGFAISYTAPDSRECTAQVSSDAFATEASVATITDGGGGTSRTTTFTGLASSTNYAWRLICYRLQTSTLYAMDQITNGTITTTAGEALGIQVNGGVFATGSIQ